MDISLNEDQKRLFETALEFGREHLTPDQIRDLEATENGFLPSTWGAMAEMGWLGAVFPEAYGGSEVGFTELGLLVEALGQSAIPSPFFSTVIDSGLLLLEAGSEAQKQEWLPLISAGEAILTTAILEKSGSLEPQAVQATLKRRGEELLLNGRKTLVRDAAAADAIICLARTGPAASDLSLVIVPRDAAGLSFRKLVAGGGESLWEADFDEVAIPAGALVGEFDGAWPHVIALLQRGAAFKSAELAGIGQAALNLTLDYAKTRIQFDRPIGSFQAVQHHCANMYRDIEVCRLLAWQAVASAESSQAVREVSMAKAKCSQAIPAVTRLAHQVHGAIGFYRNYPLELYYTRAVAAKAAYGDAYYHRRVLSQLLRDNPSQFRREEGHVLPVYHV